MRKLISLLLSVALMFALAMPAMAATVKQEATAAAIKAGETVTVTVTLDEDVADIVMYQYSLYYNKSLFTMTGSTGSAVISNALSDADGDYFMISFVDTTSTGVTVSAGTLAALTFQAKEDLTEEQAASFLLRQDYFWDSSYSDVEGISLENGTVSVTVSPEVAETATYTVTLTEGTGYTIAPTEGSVSPVEEGGSYSFTVTVSEGYEGTPVVKANGTELTLTDGAYTVSDIAEDVVITVEGITESVTEAATYTVTLTEGAGYTIAPAEGSVNPVEEGGSYAFTVTVSEGYEGTPVVKANSLNVTCVDGVYTINDIHSDQTVTVEGLKEEGLAADRKVYTHGVDATKWPANGTYPVVVNSLTLKGLCVTDVRWDGNDCYITLHTGTAADTSFSLAGVAVVNGGAPQMMAAFSAAVNGTAVTVSNGGGFEYRGALVGGKADVVVTASVNGNSEDKTFHLAVAGASEPTPDPVPETYEVTLTEGAGYTIAATEGSVSPVAEGGSYSFTVTVAENYEGTPVVKANGTELTAVEGVYTIENISADQTVTVEGIAEKVYTYEVTLSAGTGYTIAATEGSVSPVAEGGSFSFTVTVSEGYEGTPVVKANGTVLTAENGIYTIGNISADQTVTVEGITEKIYTYEVTLTEGIGYTIAATEGSVSPVIRGGSFSFTVVTENGYEGPVTVKVNDVEITAENGVYTIADITGDQVVTVEGISVKANMYTVTASADVTASKGENVAVGIQVTGNSNEAITGYNDYDVTVSYDPSVLTYVSGTAAHSGAEITNDAQRGTVRIVGHGDAKTWSDALAALTFTAEASGIHDVTITSAKIDNSGNAIALNAPEAAVTDQATSVLVAYPVTLPDNFTGEPTVLPGGDYRFTAPNGYYDITVTVDGQTVTPEVDGLVYTLRGVSGEVVITAVGKTYDVTKNGENATINGADTAQYGVDYTFTVEADSGCAVTNVSVQIGGADVEHTITDGTYVIGGSKITGAVTVTATAQMQVAGTTQITFEGVDASEVVGGLVQFAPNGQDFTFELNELEGYVYTATLDEEELEAENGVYTIPGAQINGTALTVAISKELYSFEPEVTVSQYIQLDGTVMWLVTASDEDENILAYGEEGTMFWSEKYDAYCWLVVSEESETAVKQAAVAAIKVAAEGSVSRSVMYDQDVNQSGAVDINDAQLTYDMYQAKLYSGFTTVTMDKFLEADVNGDKLVNVEDAAAVVAEILN